MDQPGAVEQSLFISYRRSDTGGYAGRLADVLEQRFGAGRVFHDVEAIAPGTDFAAAIESAVAGAGVVLVLIGDGWLDARDASGARLLDREDDFVRLEASRALARGRPVLPLLVEGARMPAADALPPDLSRLARQQALELSDSRWAHDVERLVEAITRLGVAPARGQPVPARRRGLLALGIVAGVGAAGIGAFMLRPAPLPELAGRWDLPNGSHWTIVQERERLRIEETHYLSRQVWKRGSGTIGPDGVRVSLDWMFERLPPETGLLTLSADGRTLSGELLAPGAWNGKDRRTAAVLVRR